MSSLARSRSGRFALALVVALAGSSSIATAAAGRADSGTAWVSANHTEGSTLFVSGDVKDKILGRASIVYQTTFSAGPATGSVTVTAKTVTLYAKGGSLTGTGSGLQSVDAAGNVTVTNGKINLTKGAGKLKGHSFKATFSGPFKDGVYTFKYKGTYK